MARRAGTWAARLLLPLLLSGVFTGTAVGATAAAAAFATGVGRAGSSPPTTGDMPGMDHGTGDMPAKEPSKGNLPGTDPGHGDTGETVRDRPLTPVLGVFGAGSSAVLLAAAVLRRKDRAARLAKAARRASRAQA